MPLPALQALIWESVGIIRTGTVWTRRRYPGRLAEVPAEPSDRPSYELNNLVLTGRLVTEAALSKESRGARFRTDFPETSPDWLKHIVLTR